MTVSSFEDLSRRYQSVRIQYRNIHLLGIELYKTRNNISSHIMNELFEQRNLIQYEITNRFYNRTNALFIMV